MGWPNFGILRIDPFSQVSFDAPLNYFNSKNVFEDIRRRQSNLLQQIIISYFDTHSYSK